MAEGDLPHWDRTWLAGRPFLADPSHGLFQPFNAVFAVLPAESARAWHASLCLFLMGLFFSLFLRSLGVRYTSAFAGGVAYACSGLAAGVMLNPQTLTALVWTPLVFWAVSEYGISFRIRTAALAGVAFAMLLLSGTVIIAVVMAALALAYGIVVVLSPPSEESPAAGRRAAGLGIMVGAGVGLTAFQWLPALLWISTLSNLSSVFTAPDVLGDAPRGAYEFLAQIVASTGLSSSCAAYVGVAALPLLAAALFHGSLRPAVFFAAIALSAAGVAAAGAAAARLAAPVWTLGACALAGLGLDAVMSPGRDFRSPRIWCPLAIYVTAAAALAFVSPAGAVGRLAFGVIIVLACTLLRSRIASPVFTVLYAALLLLDLAAINSQSTVPASPRVISRTDAAPLSLARELAAQGRVLIAAQLVASHSAGDGSFLNLLTAGDPFQRMPDEQEQWWVTLFGEPHTQDAGPPVGDWTDWPHPMLLNHLAVRVVLTPAGIAPPTEWEKARVTLRLQRALDDADIYLNDSALPRVYWAPQWRCVPDGEAALNVLMDPGFAAGAECAVEGSAPEPDAAINRETLAMTPCTLELAGPDHVRVLVDAPADGIVVLADAFAPGWRATVDGRPAEVLRVNGLLRGVAVAKGAHLILFHYTIPGWYAGLALSLATILALIAAPILRRRW